MSFQEFIFLVVSMTWASTFEEMRAQRRTIWSNLFFTKTQNKDRVFQ
jgi:hypothetical protein